MYIPPEGSNNINNNNQSYNAYHSDDNPQLFYNPQLNFDAPQQFPTITIEKK
jgi:hypothetical protein